MKNEFKAVIVIILIVIASFFIISWALGIHSSIELNRKYESMGWNNTLLANYATMAAQCDKEYKSGDALRNELLNGKTVFIWQLDNGWIDDGNHFNWDKFAVPELEIPHIDPSIDTPANVTIVAYIHGYYQKAGKYTDGQLATDSCYDISMYNVQTNKKFFQKQFCNYAPQVKYGSGHGGAPFPEILVILNNMV